MVGPGLWPWGTRVRRGAYPGPIMDGAQDAMPAEGEEWWRLGPRRGNDDAAQHVLAIWQARVQSVARTTWFLARIG